MNMKKDEMIAFMLKHSSETPNPIPAKPVLLEKIRKKKLKEQYVIDSMAEKVSCSVLRLSLRIESYRLHKISKFRLISWFGNFVGRHSFRVIQSSMKTVHFQKISIPGN